MGGNHEQPLRNGCKLVQDGTELVGARQLSQIDVYKRMKRIMLTMGNAFANLYTPAAMPVIMNNYETVEKDMLGKIDPSSRMYEEYNQDLLAVEENQYARWIRIKQI